MFDSRTIPEYRSEIDAFVAERAAVFGAALDEPWQLSLNDPHYPRPLMDDLYVAAVALQAAARIEASPTQSLQDAVDDARVFLVSTGQHRLNRVTVFNRVKRLFLRAQVNPIVLPDGISDDLATRIYALQSHWEAMTCALEAFAQNLDAIKREHGDGLPLSATAARERQVGVDTAAYAHVVRAFLDHHRSGITPLTIDDGTIRELLLGGEHSDGLFSPIRAFTMLYHCFSRVVEDLSRQQAADAFVGAFSLTSDTEPRTVRGRVVIELRAWIDSFDKAHLGRVRYDYESRARIEKALRAIANLWFYLSGSGDGVRATSEVENALRAFTDADWSPGPALKPSLLGVELRCFQRRIDCLIPEAFAAEINGFVTMHSRVLRERCGG